MAAEAECKEQEKRAELEAVAPEMLLMLSKGTWKNVRMGLILANEEHTFTFNFSSEDLLEGTLHVTDPEQNQKYPVRIEEITNDHVMHIYDPGTSETYEIISTYVSLKEVLKAENGYSKTWEFSCMKNPENFIWEILDFRPTPSAQVKFFHFAEYAACTAFSARGLA